MLILSPFLIDNHLLIVLYQKLKKLKFGQKMMQKIATMLQRNKMNKNSLSNLTDWSTMDPEYKRNLQSKGGMAVTPYRRMKYKLSGMKRRFKHGNITDEDEQWLIQRATDRDAICLDMLKWIDDIKEKIDNEHLEIKLLSVYNSIAKTIHGERIKSENLNVNVNIDMNQEIINAYKRVKEMKKDENKD